MPITATPDGVIRTHDDARQVIRAIVSGRVSFPQPGFVDHATPIERAKVGAYVTRLGGSTYTLPCTVDELRDEVHSTLRTHGA